ncbi:hypothetical protein A8L34_28170 [Bacillus sp. FJAT-27264]|uniref:hypothetical protein n=1 Tax=Paenibacillus sp. (strain DSM 101736 / FJAT-27264) TaxID=1850362 RepID=UPI000807BC0C|nr:hypothetical protein [Bacillus sp. FJAT-27264]OBZ15925.1 hypothetical protein A8L34_28170 [Bacillus sp. FJAT-27264]
MEKKWVTVDTLSGYDVQILNGAEQDDCMDYRIAPALKEGKNYLTIHDALVAIRQYNNIS